MAFMSAWYHLQGDKAYRDKAAQSAALLTSAAGIDPDFAFKALLGYEKLWRTAFRQHGIA